MTEVTGTEASQAPAAQAPSQPGGPGWAGRAGGSQAHSGPGVHGGEGGVQAVRVPEEPKCFTNTSGPSTELSLDGVQSEMCLATTELQGSAHRVHTESQECSVPVLSCSGSLPPSSPGLVSGSCPLLSLAQEEARHSTRTHSAQDSLQALWWAYCTAPQPELEVVPAWGSQMPPQGSMSWLRHSPWAGSPGRCLRASAKELYYSHLHTLCTDQARPQAPPQFRESSISLDKA